MKGAGARREAEAANRRMQQASGAGVVLELLIKHADRCSCLHRKRRKAAYTRALLELLQDKGFEPFEVE